MKNLTAFLAMLLAFHAGQSQSLATRVSFNKTDRPALMLAIPYPETVAEGTIIENLKKTGYDAETRGKLFWKQNKMNGYYVFKGVNINKQLVDLYFRVEGSGRKNENSVIYLLVGKNEEFFVSEESDQGTYIAAKKFFDNFLSDAEAFKLQTDINEQEAVIKLAEKKFARYQEQETDILKRIEQLQDELKNNRSQQEEQQKEIKKEEKKLVELKDRQARSRDIL